MILDEEQIKEAKEWQRYDDPTVETDNLEDGGQYTPIIEEYIKPNYQMTPAGMTPGGNFSVWEG